MGTNYEGVASYKNSNVGRGVIAIVLAVVAFFAGEAAGFITKSGSLNASALGFAFRSVVALIPFLILGGGKWFKFDKKTVGKTLKFTLPLLITNIALALLLLYTVVKSGVSEGALGRVCTTVYIAVLVGFNEELIFRGLLFQGIHTVMGKKKSAMLISAIISSVVFGLVHVITSLDFSNIIGFLTAFMKTFETSMFGFVLCYCCYFFKDIRGAIIFHAIFDWVVLVMTVLNDGSGNLNISYTTTDAKKGVGQMIMFGLMIIIYAPCTIKSFKAFKKAEPSEGLFAE